MSRLILIIAIALAAWIIWHFVRQNVKKHGRGYLIKVGLIALAAVILLAVLTGRAHALFALVAAAIPFVGRALQYLRYLPMARQLYGQFRGVAGGGNRSNVRTEWLAMTLDHSSGEIDGEVLKGAFAGHTLSSLDISQLQQLHADCAQNDPEALRLLLAYLQRERAGEWQGGDESGHQDTGPSGPMQMDEAWDILGLSPGATREEIVATHRRLMSKLHPDKGGSNFLASQINRAKDLLLKHVG